MKPETILPTIERVSSIPRRIAMLDDAVQHCTNCPLYKFATQGVLGDGAAHPAMMLVGEQPGNEEDIEGRPFVGPAGQVLSRALEECGIERRDIYITNAVKHFKFEERGKRRLHKRPNTSEINACHPWLEAEIRALKPRLIVCLGATAARAVLGKSVTIKSVRGKRFMLPLGITVAVTIHPSAILRVPDRTMREETFRGLVEDLKHYNKMSHTTPPPNLDGGALSNSL